MATKTTDEPVSTVRISGFLRGKLLAIQARLYQDTGRKPTQPEVLERALELYGRKITAGGEDERAG